SRAERLLEEQVGRRLRGEVRQLASELATPGVRARFDDDAWRQRAASMQLGRSGYVVMVDGSGTVVAGSRDVTRLGDLGLRPALVAELLGGVEQPQVDRTGTQRILGSAHIGASPDRVIAVAYRRDFEGELTAILGSGLVIFAMGFLLAGLQALLF